LPAHVRALPARQALGILAQAERNAGADSPLEARAKELRTQLEQHFQARSSHACQEVDALVSAAMHKLPPCVRSLPARQALCLLPGSSAGALPPMEALRLLAIAAQGLQQQEEAPAAAAGEGGAPSAALARRWAEVEENLKQSIRLQRELAGTLQHLDALTSEERRLLQRRYKRQSEALLLKHSLSTSPGSAPRSSLGPPSGGA